MNVNDPVSTIMTRTVVVANQFHNFSEALELFHTHHIRHLPIVDGKNHLIGIISSNDIMKLFVNPKYRALPINNDEIDKAINITEIMTHNPVTLKPTDTIKHASKLFVENKFHALPVTENGELKGIISIKDIVHLIAYFS